MRHLLSLALLALCLLPTPATATKLAARGIDPISTAAIAEATTDSSYLTPWVASMPEHLTVPSPRDHLGYTVGTPDRVTQVEDIHAYFRALDLASERVLVESLGRSTEGREMLLAVIADRETILRLEHYRGLLKRLADPRITDPETAERIVDEAKPVYWVTAGLHSPELGPPEAAMELAYRLAVEEREPFVGIRKNLITLVTPVLEPDGRARQVDWTRRHVVGHSDYKDMPPRSAPFWGHYTFHDNNRDGIAISQPLTRNYLQGFFRWLPTVSLDLHESVPLLYVSTGTGPYNQRVDPLTVSEWHTLANYEVGRLTGMGLPGVWTWGFYTGWYPGYLLWVTNNHNAMGRFFETFGNGSPTTMERDLSESRFAGKKITSRQWYRSVPPPDELMWSMRNNTNYMLTGVIASLEMVSTNGRLFLENFHQKAVNALEEGRTRAPYAYLLPREQRDPAAWREAVAILHRHGIEMGRVHDDGSYGEVELREGDVLVKLDQPYGPLARNLLEIQDFPTEVEVPPYDDVAWTLGLLLGVTTHAIDDPGVLEARVQELAPGDLRPEAVELPKKPRYLAIPHRGQRGLGPFRWAWKDTPMWALEENVERKGGDLPPGTLLFDASELDRDRLAASLGEHGLTAVTLKAVPKAKVHEVDLPRLAVLVSWTAPQNAGWVRYTLDQAGIPYTLIAKERLRAGDLRRDFDTILVPVFWSGTQAKSVVAGIDPKWSPLAYERGAATPNHGLILSSPDITGGMGLAGLAELQRFVEEGGTLVGLGSGGTLAAETGMLHEVSTARPGGLKTPGSILTARVVDPHSPLVYGYDELSWVFRGNGPLFTVDEHDRHLVALQFGTKRVGDDEAEEDSEEELPPLVRSGGVVEPEKIDGEPALLHVALGEGRVVLFSFNPMHRHVNQHDHALVYNALLHWNDLPVPVRDPKEPPTPLEPKE